MQFIVDISLKISKIIEVTLESWPSGLRHHLGKVA